MNELRYPIGRFEHEGPVGDEDLDRWIEQIEALPAQLRSTVSDLADDQLEASYRPGGWSIRQVVHHLPDSHLNAYVRFKWALTEDEPTIKTYDQEAWAELADYRTAPLDTSLDFLGLLHARWVHLLRTISREQLERRFEHPVSGPSELAWNVGMYAWHGRHHLAHVRSKIEREDW